MRATGAIKRKIASYFYNIINARVDEKMSYMLPQFLEYNNSPAEARGSFFDHTKNVGQSIDYYHRLKDQLVGTGVPVKEESVDIDDFERWLDDFREIRDYYANMNDVIIEKCLKHYLSYKYLKLSHRDVYLDVAACHSPWAGSMGRRCVKSYSLDLSFRPGVHGKRICADAGDTGLDSGFASALSLQCAYECFMGDADVRFLREAGRILGKSGRYVIVPLYLDSEYFVLTSPLYDQRKVRIDTGASSNQGL